MNSPTQFYYGVIRLKRLISFEATGLNKTFDHTDLKTVMPAQISFEQNYKYELNETTKLPHRESGERGTFWNLKLSKSRLAEAFCQQ